MNSETFSSDFMSIANNYISIAKRSNPAYGFEDFLTDLDKAMPKFTVREMVKFAFNPEALKKIELDTAAAMYFMVFKYTDNR
jgi:hypothetical protein